MEETDLVGKIAGMVVLLSVIPYAFRVWQGKITPNIISWSVWCLIGLSLLLSYESSGAGDSIWPAVFSFVNPFIVTIIAVFFSENKVARPGIIDWWCGGIGVFSIILWFFWRSDVEMAQFALYTAITADLVALVPTILWGWKHPDKDRPLMWFVFACGYGLSIFVIKDHTFANYSLPVYMVVGSSLVVYPLVRYRIRKKISFAEWV